MQVLIFLLNMAISTSTDYGGYEYSFVNTPPDCCMCNICQLPSRDAYMTGPCCEGLTICKSCLDHWEVTACLDHWQVTAGNKKCPVCQKDEGGFNKNYPIQREIKSLHIFCTNKEKGCEWQGELNDINNHLFNSNGCQFEEVKCANKCGEMIQRQYLTSHVETECPRRKVNCQYCHVSGEHQFIEGLHKEECPKLPLPCPNKCEVGSLPREDMEAHRKECHLEMIQCEYYSVGCKLAKLARKDMKKHDDENMKEHLMMTYHKLINTEAQLAAALKQTASLTAILMNAQLGPNTAASHANIIHNKAEIFKCSNQTCPVTIKMSQYSIKRRDEIEWYTDPFYTDNKGYKMRLGVCAAGNGKGEGTHLSVFMYLMKGPHDDDLTWPLRRRFEIKLLNQICDSGHYSPTLTYGDNTPGIRVTEGNKSKNGWGFPTYISDENLYKITPMYQFLKDDCLFFQVTKL